jgi:long-chain acyl-CoA synthetase
MPLHAILEESAKKWADKPALEFMGRQINYRELNDLANHAAKGLQNLGVKPGVHVGLYLPNTPHYVIAFFGVMKAGGTVVNYSPLDAEKVLEHKVEDSQTDFLVTLDLKALYPQMARLLGKTRLKKLIVGEMAEMTRAPDSVRGDMSRTDQLAPVPSDDRHSTFQQLLDNDGKCQLYALGDLKEAIAVLQYTGGTTGLPKGAMLTHANLSAATSQCLETIQTEPPVLEEGKERVLAVLPPFHIYALTVNMLLGLRLGAELVCIPASRRAARRCPWRCCANSSGPSTSGCSRATVSPRRRQSSHSTSCSGRRSPGPWVCRSSVSTFGVWTSTTTRCRRENAARSWSGART